VEGSHCLTNALFLFGSVFLGVDTDYNCRSQIVIHEH
jgi:hypothetical protein